jgi:hypothetical protein
MNVHDEERSEHLHLVTNDLKDRVNANIQERRQFRISEFHEFSGFQSLRSDQETKDAVHAQLKGLPATFF